MNNGKNIIVLLDFRCYFEAYDRNHFYFRLNSMACHFPTFRSPCSKLEFVYPPCCGVEEQMLIFSSSLTPGLVKGSNDTRSHPPNVLEFLFEFFVVQCILVKSGAVNSGEMQCILVKSDEFENSSHLIAAERALASEQQHNQG